MGCDTKQNGILCGLLLEFYLYIFVNIKSFLEVIKVKTMLGFEYPIGFLMLSKIPEHYLCHFFQLFRLMTIYTEQFVQQNLVYSMLSNGN